jgi:hypothetical protein
VIVQQERGTDVKIPRELRRSIPPVVQELADWRIVSFVVAVMLVPCLYGSPRFPNGWIRYLPAFIGPLLTTAVFFVRLWNPYKSYFAKRNGYGEEDVKDDPAAQRLIQLTRSRAARLLVLRTGLITTLALSTLAFILAGLQAPASNWDFSPARIFLASLLWAGVAGWVVMFDLMRWSIAMWKVETAKLQTRERA